jgi:hypothetical protein
MSIGILDCKSSMQDLIDRCKDKTELGGVSNNASIRVIEDASVSDFIFNMSQEDVED